MRLRKAGAFASLDVRNRMLLWTILVLLTITLLLYPVRLICQYSPIQAPHIFSNLPLFASLLCIWTLVLVALALSKPDRADGVDWENLALGCLFGVVFWGFWVVITPFGSYADDLYNQGHVRWILQEATIPVGHENLAYFDFPGMHVLVSAVSLLTGLGVPASRTLFLLANCLIFSALLLLFFQRILGSNRLALLSLLLAVIGNTVLGDRIRVFTPGAMGFTLLAGFLLLVARSENGSPATGTADRVMMLIIFTAMVTTYFPNSLLVPLILLGILVVQTIAGHRAGQSGLSAIGLFVVMVLAWSMYWTWHTFDELTDFLPSFADQMTSGGFLDTALRLGTSSVGGPLPSWATATRLIWWALLGLSTLLCLYSLLRVKRLNRSESVVAGAMLGVIVLALLSVFGTEEGYEFARFLLYAPLFAFPAALMLLARSRWPWNAGRLLAAVLACILVLPAFLSLVNTVSTDAIYAWDVSGGTFLESHSTDKGESHVVYGTSADSVALPRFYTPDAEIRRVPWNVVYSRSEDRVWEEVSKLLASFTEPGAEGTRQKLFIVNEKSTVPYLHLLGIPLDDPGWARMKEVLSASSLIYDSGHLEMYVPA